MNKKPHSTPLPIKLNLIDRAIGFFSPKAGIERARDRSAWQSLGSAGYITFGSSKKSMRGAIATHGSAETDINPKLSDLRASSRDLRMNSPLAGAALNRKATNAIGYGLMLQSRIDREFLKISNEEADKWQRDVERRFKIWSKSENCDASRIQNFAEMQFLTCFTKLESGDVFVALQRKKRKNWPFQLCLKIIEADHITNPGNGFDSDKISGGVEKDADGEPVAYHILKKHPGGYYPSCETLRVPVYSEKTGRRTILHIMKKGRPGQVRGIPELAPVIESLKQITRLTEAELTAAVITAFFTVFVKRTTPAGNPLNDGFAGTDESIKNPQSQTDASSLELGSGTIADLADDEDIVVADPKRPNAAYLPFFEGLARQIGANIDVPFEVLMLHFQSSYSAARTALLQAWKSFLLERWGICWNLCEPVYEEWLYDEVVAGRIVAPGFIEDPEYAAAWSGSVWIGPGMGQINPEAETKAALSRIDAKLSTRTKEVAAIDGDDWDAVIATLAEEDKKIKDLGLKNEVKPPPFSQEKPVQEESEDIDKRETEPTEPEQSDDE